MGCEWLSFFLGIVSGDLRDLVGFDRSGCLRLGDFFFNIWECIC